MTFTWWLIPIVVLGALLIVAPFIGRAWAHRDEERHRWAPEMRRRGWRP